MKTSFITVVLFSLLLISPLTVQSASTAPSIRLPGEMVTMNAVYGKTSYFTIVLSDVPSGFDIINGTYHGWCVQKSILMTQHVNHTVVLHSSYDTDLPTGFRFADWDKINYILNHKHGGRNSIQNAIWHYTNNIDCSTDQNASLMVQDADQNGRGYIPGPGELLTVPLEGVPVIQLTFLELLIPRHGQLEGLVWFDTNINGLQDSGEPGIAGVMVKLYQQENILLKTTITTTQGYYSFTNITPGEFYLQFVLPSGYHFSPKNVGSNDTCDSDADLLTGRTIPFIVQANDSITIWDAGMYLPSSPRSGGHRNHRPTADGSAGEPYKGFPHQILTFNGSRSYDRDGRIISWRWDFGDGTIENNMTVIHAYEKPGTYTATLTVTDNWYAADVYTTMVTITTGNNPSSTPNVLGPLKGHVNTTYLFRVQSTDPDDDTLLYLLDWGDGVLGTSPLFPSGRPITTTHRWSTYGFYTVRISAIDRYYASSNVYTMVIAIDVCSVGTYGYLIDKDSDGTYDVFHSNVTRGETKALRQENGEYLIDIDGDQRWDIIYNPASQFLNDYHEPPLLDYLIFAILIVSFLLILFLGRKKGRTITYTRK